MESGARTDEVNRSMGEVTDAIDMTMDTIDDLEEDDQDTEEEALDEEVMRLMDSLEFEIEPPPDVPAAPSAEVDPEIAILGDDPPPSPGQDRRRRPPPPPPPGQILVLEVPDSGSATQSQRLPPRRGSAPQPLPPTTTADRAVPKATHRSRVDTAAPGREVSRYGRRDEERQRLEATPKPRESKISTGTVSAMATADGQTTPERHAAPAGTRAVTAAPPSVYADATLGTRRHVRLGVDAYEAKYDEDEADGYATPRVPQSSPVDPRPTDGHSP
jgi:hypothetical protein